MLNEQFLELIIAISRKKSWISTHFWLKLVLRYFDEKTENEQKTFKLTVCHSSVYNVIFLQAPEFSG
jgi:hypothetical protein